MRVGILGGGQLGRMLALAAAPLGIHTRCWTDRSTTSAPAVGETVLGPTDDPAALAAFADGLDVVTWESENVSAHVLRELSGRVPVMPGLRSLEVGADRVAEKLLFARVGAASSRWLPVDTAEQAAAAAQRLILPAILKQRTGGYDGRGQRRVRQPADAGLAFDQLGGAPCILEEQVHFEREVSQLAARARDGTLAFWPLTENVHHDGVLRISRAPAPADDAFQSEVRGITARIMQDLDHVGVLAVEFMVVAGRPLALEIAPRVHNSGHWTLDGSDTSQFENHVRAIAGLPLGSTTTRQPCAMLNLLGATPDRGRLLAVPGTRLHHYGKAAAPRRKLGHVNVRASNLEELEIRVAAVEALLSA